MSEEIIKIKIKTTSDGKVYFVEVATSKTISELKSQLQPITNIAPELQSLVFKGKILANENTVASYGVKTDNTIILVKKVNPQPSSSSSSSNTNTNTNNTQNNSQQNPQNQNQSSQNQNNNNQDGQGMPNNPFANMNMNDLFSGMGGMDYSSLGGMGGMGGMGMDPSQAMQMMSNPMIRNMVMELINNPQMMNMVMNNPMMQNMMNQNPQMRTMMQNPELMRNMMNMMFGGGNSQGQSGQGQGGMPDFSSLMNMMGGGMGQSQPGQGQNQDAGNAGTGMNMDFSVPQDDGVDPKEKYKEQLKQLKEMGFCNEETNIAVLKQCQGNVQFAIEKLINMFQ